MVFIETPIFTKLIQSLLTDDELKQLQAYLIECPSAGNLLKGGGGLRKLRWARQGTGKSGGIRTIYYWANKDEQIFFVFAYPKAKTEALSSEQLVQLAKVVKEEFGNG